MKRQALGLTAAFLLVGAGALEAQASARIEYKNGRIGVAVAVGDLPVHVRPQRTPTRVWVAADWAPVRVWTTPGRPYWRREVLDRGELQRVVGKETVRGIDRHAKALGLRGPMEGRWFRMDRYSVMLEVTVRGIPVAELHDYGSDGYMDRVLLMERVRYGQPHPGYGYGDDDWYDYGKDNRGNRGKGQGRGGPPW